MSAKRFAKGAAAAAVLVPMAAAPGAMAAATEFGSLSYWTGTYRQSGEFNATYDKGVVSRVQLTNLGRWDRNDKWLGGSLIKYRFVARDSGGVLQRYWPAGGSSWYMESPLSPSSAPRSFCTTQGSGSNIYNVSSPCTTWPTKWRLSMQVQTGPGVFPETNYVQIK